ncbi:MAG TPA: hypothetical protein VNO22_10005 [Planctomycetota bacterium]|nr:hypothetical protein [Planctomycetota bacterium]
MTIPWSPTDPDGVRGFEVPGERAWIGPPPGAAAGGPEPEGPFILPLARREAVHDVHDLIEELWSRLLFRLWTCGPERFPAWEAGTVLEALWSLARRDEMPPEIAGCSLRYLEEGRVWKRPVRDFGDAVFEILRDGGRRGRGVGAERAEDLTKVYLRGLAGDAPASQVHAFQLDPGFSCWFPRAGRAAAWAIAGASESWLALFLAADEESEEGAPE